MRSFLSLRRWLLPVILGFALLAGQAFLPGRAATQVAPAAPADVMIFYAVADARIRSGYPNTNYGSEHTLQLAYSEIDVPLEDVILVRFDLSTLPPRPRSIPPRWNCTSSGHKDIRLIRSAPIA